MATSDPAFAAMASDRERIYEQFRAGELSGVAFAQELSAAMDRAILETWRPLQMPSKGVALIALGGYGRGLMSPHSDVDLMVLHEGDTSLGEEAQPVFYALWDAGLKVGHAVRTKKDCVNLAKENLEAETSFLDVRLLDGDQDLFDSFAETCAAKTRKRGTAFLSDIRQMMWARHDAHGSATSQLEPNIKEGTGGLRDIHVLDWITAVVGDLVEAKLIDEPGRQELDEAHEFLIRVRGHLHLLTNRPDDVLSFELQRPVAKAMGYADNGEIAEDALMRDLFVLTRAVELTVSSVAAEVNAKKDKSRRALRSGPFTVVGGRVMLEGELDLEKRPEDAIALFSLGEVPGAAAMRNVRARLRDATISPTQPVREAFKELLRSAPGAALEMADHAGVFAALFPAWDQVRCRPQRNIYHRYTVDAHLFHTTAHAALLGESSDGITSDAASELSPAERDLLLLAALFHDVGKGTDEDHSIRGERIALELADSLGSPPDERTTLAWLVRHHLLLVDTATRRDLADENQIIEVASKIPDVNHLRLLYLLTVADGHGTGPTAWGSWKASLVNELYQKVRHVLERGELASSDANALVRQRRLEAEELAGGGAEQVARHLDGMGRAYILAFTPEELVGHALLAAGLAPGGVAAEGGAPDKGGFAKLTVVASDRPGLFNKVSGVLSLHGISIVAAQAFTREDRLALETFTCVGVLDKDLSPNRWSRVTKDVEKALRGRLAIEPRLAEKRAGYKPRRSRGTGEPPKVVVDNAISDFMTVVEVHAPDRLGLLYDLTSAMGSCELDIHVAKISTYGDDVIDVFYVRDLEGQKIRDAEHRAEIERAVMFKLS